MSNNSEDRLIILFEGLKGKNLIQDSTKFVYSPFTTNIQVLSIRKKIRCNKKFVKTLEKLDDDTLRFVLLHEENHIRNGSRRMEYALGALVAGMFLLYYYPFHIGLPWTIAYLLIFVPIIYRLSYDRMKIEEYASDKFAAEIMKINYGSTKPSEYIKKLHLIHDENLKSESGSKGKTIILILAIILGTYPDYHPSCEERMSNIIKEVE